MSIIGSDSSAQTTNVAALYAQHIATLQERTLQALQRAGLDGLVIHSGQNKRLFLDDNHYPFKVNPQFKIWLPVVDNPNCWLVVNGKDKPTLIYYQPVDFWHKVNALPQDFWVEHFNIIVLTQADAVEKHLPYDKTNHAYVGEYLEVAKALGFEQVNPVRAMHYLHYHRAYKTDYELHCMRQANRIAIRGHKAAEQAFMAGASEFDINLAYLQATRQGENELPYGNIVALNQNAAILHYMVLDTVAPTEHRSFLIDAGATYSGYAADITRTYCAQADADFNQMIAAIDAITLTLADALKPNVAYADLHILAHDGIANVLQQFDIVNLDAVDIVSEGITKTFFPHGIGHFLGLQVHDVGGLINDDRGTPKAAPSDHPFLRCTRMVEPGQVFTIEPGLYFIPSLLAELKSSPQSKYINWGRVEELAMYGGIRVEDNIIVHASHNENMTREQWD